MTTSFLKEFAELYAMGFRPYTGEIMPTVYERLHCPDCGQAFWIVNWPILHCFGCDRRCTPHTSEGFQAPLPAGSATGAPRAKGRQFEISPIQMVAAKPLLRADEAAYCLSISRSQVYALAAEGKLVRHIDLPFRVTSDSVKEEMHRVDW